MIQVELKKHVKEAVRHNTGLKQL